MLPHPPTFPNLRHITLPSFSWDPAWLGRLVQLQQLEQLEVHYWWISHGQPPQACLVPGPSTLTSLSLEVEIEKGAPPLHIDLAALPALRELQLCIGAHIELRTAPLGAASSPGPAHGLQRLRLRRACSATVDFAALPSLTSLELGEVSQLAETPGAATIVGTTSLRYLALGGDLEEAWSAGYFQLGQPWVLELLRHAPPALRGLQLCGFWLAAVAEVVAGLRQLQALSIQDPLEGCPEVAPAVQRLADGPVLEDLQALRWACVAPLPQVKARGLLACWVVHEASLRTCSLVCARVQPREGGKSWYVVRRRTHQPASPVIAKPNPRGCCPLQAVCKATDLQLLYFYSPGLLRRREIRLLSSLPALRHLRIAGPYTHLEEQEAAVEKARRLLPHLGSVELMCNRGWEIYEHETAELLLE